MHHEHEHIGVQTNLMCLLTPRTKLIGIIYEDFNNCSENGLQYARNSKSDL